MWLGHSVVMSQSLQPQHGFKPCLFPFLPGKLQTSPTSPWDVFFHLKFGECLWSMWGRCIFQFMCTHTGVHMEAKSQPGYCSLEAVRLIKTGSLSKTWDLSIGLGWLASEPQRSASLRLPNTEITSVPRFWQEFLRSISGPDACIASPSPSELSPQPLPFDYLVLHTGWLRSCIYNNWLDTHSTSLQYVELIMSLSQIGKLRPRCKDHLLSTTGKLKSQGPCFKCWEIHGHTSGHHTVP